MATDTAKVLTIGDVADHLRVSKGTIYRLMKRGKFAPNNPRFRQVHSLGFECLGDLDCPWTSEVR